MKKYFYCLGLVILFVSCDQNNSPESIEQDSIGDQAAMSDGRFKVEKLAGDFKFTEGPAVDAEGNVYFTDLRQNMILVWTTNEQLDTFRLNSGRANGLYFDANGNLLVCEGDKGQISLTDPQGAQKTIAATYNGVRFNQPNDLWLDEKGGIYFTDPKYGGNDEEISQDGMHVYYISPSDSSVIRVCDDFEKPNGLIGTPDGKILYVTDPQAGKTFKYDVQDDGSLANKSLFVDLGCDGMTIDTSGCIYMTPSGKKVVEIYTSSGNLVDSIQVPERPSNLCFGGKNRNQLYITARTSIYRVAMETKGVD